MAASELQRERRALRRRMRDLRSQLGEHQKRLADTQLVRHIVSTGAYRSAKHVALFLGFDGEPDLRPLISSGEGHGKRIYVPVLTRKRMQFGRLSPGAATRLNWFGIVEPETTETLDARRLDLVLTPLLAVDARGARVGFGGGYYDRCFRFLLDRHHWKRPKLLGVCYEFQRVRHIETASWDVPLWGVATPEGIHTFQGDLSK